MLVVGAALFCLLLALVLWYCSNVLLYALWNSKWSRNARKNAIKALIDAEKWLQENGGDING